MKKSLESSLDYKGKYYELRRSAKELIFENSAYQAEILECQKMVNLIFHRFYVGSCSFGDVH